MKAGNIPLANKLRAFLGELLEHGKLDSDELTILFDEVIVGEDSPRADTVIEGARILMMDYLKRKIMTSDEMQIVVDQAITLTRASGGNLSAVACSFSIVTSEYSGYTIN